MMHCGWVTWCTNPPLRPVAADLSDRARPVPQELEPVRPAVLVVVHHVTRQVVHGAVQHGHRPEVMRQGLFLWRGRVGGMSEQSQNKSYMWLSRRKRGIGKKLKRVWKSFKRVWKPFECVCVFSYPPFSSGRSQMSTNREMQVDASVAFPREEQCEVFSVPNSRAVKKRKGCTALGSNTGALVEIRRLYQGDDMHFANTGTRTCTSCEGCYWI